MVRRSFRIGLRVGLLLGVIVAIVKVMQTRRSAQPDGWNAEPKPWVPPPAPVIALAEPAAEPVPVKKAAPTKKAAAKKAPAAPVADKPTWMAPVDGACPPGYPLKAKLSSKIFHVPGGLAYERTGPDRCYADEAAAEADGFTRAKR